MSEEIIFIDTARGLEFYSDGTSNVMREQLQCLKQENKFLIRQYEALLKHDKEKELYRIEFQGCQKENELLKSELHSKTEYIQEQRDIIEQYRNEIKMYKKCQGKRASKRETELRKALEEINLILDELKQQYDYMSDYSEIREIQDKINEVLA